MNNPLKRASVDSDPEEYQRHPDLWFDDGSIVLKVQTTLFKVHRTLLSSHSTVFADIFSVPQPATQDQIEGCPIVEAPDSANDFTCLLKAIYDPTYADNTMDSFNDKALTFQDLEGILRLSTKYDLRVLRRKSIQHLKKHYPSELELAFEANSCDLTQALLLCHECNVLEPLPFIYYRLTEGSVDQMLSKIDSLPKHEWRICLSGRERLLDAQRVVHRFAWNPPPSPTCTSPDSCANEGTRKQEIYLAKKWDRRQHCLWQTSEIQKVLLGFCHNCQAAFLSQLPLDNKKYWEELPDFFTLGTWEELRNSGS